MEALAPSPARRLIEKINRELTLDGAIIGTRFEALVSNCLEILSNQLYTKSTHFLLELIQNADDNTYHCSTPTLSFSYKPGSLRIDCNEAGFTAENIEAVCSINQSTKSGKTHYGDSIGEKGIGFKSVFKAADVVWISSREFTFKFDKTKCLGMVTPIWAEFPESTQPGYTSMYLQLSEDYDEDTLVHELLTFDSNFLIFLRRIEEINIRVACQNAQAWETKIRKVKPEKAEDRTVILYSGDTSFRYLIRTHVVNDLPREKKRPNWHQTKLLLAFPTFDSLEKPRLTPQNVYAFLPIRNYGLKFLIQGDFLLTANREDIESTLPWNRAIRDAFVEAFLREIELFNEGSMKYVWPHYLPSKSTAVGTFFEPAIANILTQLKERPVLESCAGTMVKASSLKHVPLKPFADEQGVPFTLGPHTAAYYLSSKYPEWAIEAISSIGVSQISPKEFLEDLISIITLDPTAFYSKPATWHSQLADTLVKLGTDKELMSIIQDISIIPLSDGNWTSARGKTILFSKGESSLDIPSGIEVFTVDQIAELDHNRHRLFADLGVKAWEAAEICRLILKTHECPDLDPKSLTTAQLVSHARFLYKASWQPPKTADLWFATSQDERCLGRKLYILGDADKDSASARIFAQLKKKFPVIHNDYLAALPSDEDWPTWLVDNLGLWMIPRLVSPHIDPKPQPTQTLDTFENNMAYAFQADLLSKEPTSPVVDSRFATRRDTRVEAMNPLQQQSSQESQNAYTPLGIFIPGSQIPPEEHRMDGLPENIPTRRHEVSAQGLVQVGKGSPGSMDGPDGQVRLTGLGIKKKSSLQLKRQQPGQDSLLVQQESLSMFKPSLIRALPTLTEEEKTEFEQSLQGLWNKLGATVPDSEENKQVTRDILDFSQMITANIQQRKTGKWSIQQQVQDGQYQQSQHSQLNQASQLPNTQTPKTTSQNGGLKKEASAAFNPNKHCGVLGATGRPCMRSITCKTHSKQAKRAVSGRSKSWDVLLDEYHRSVSLMQTKKSLPPIPSARSSRSSSLSSVAPNSPTLPHPPVAPTLVFQLSEEFLFMVRECDTSDVLQLLRDNWSHYSQWIDGAHMKWQSPDFVASSANLKNSLGACQVQSAKGPLLLQETVLPKIDLELGEGCRIPAVNIDDAHHPEWSLLSSFNVVVKADIHYYLRCLISISDDSHSDIEKLAYIYEKIQDNIRGNEELVHTVFWEKNIILLPSKQTSTELNAWANMATCLSKSITVESIYPSSSYLFRCLASPAGDPIAAKVAAANFITTSTTLEDISRFFRDLSATLENVNATKASQLLRPLQHKPIFPVTFGSGKRDYDKLVDMRDAAWFIADQPLIRESFHGKLPLLALAIEDLDALQDLFRVLRPEGRILSRNVTSRAIPRGRIRIHWKYTASLRKKSPFIKSLVPRSHNDYATILQQISQVRVSVATEINQTFAVNISGTEAHGYPVSGQVSLSNSGNALSLYMTDECAEAKCPPYELVSLMADTLGIKDPAHYSLLYITLTNEDMESILSAFSQQGIRPDGLNLNKPNKTFGSLEQHSTRIPSFSQARFTESFQGSSDGMSLGQIQPGVYNHGMNDRRLPMRRQIQLGELVLDQNESDLLVPENPKLSGWTELQYLGEHMVSKIFQAHLGPYYIPERDWTSSLRGRSEYKPFDDQVTCAAFTMTDTQLVSQMTSFLLKYGRSRTAGWKESIQENQPIYHLDLFVSSSSKSSSFVITSSQIERMRQYQLISSRFIPEVSVLIKVGNVYSEDQLSIDIVVDPWQLFDTSDLSLESGWVMTGNMPWTNARSTRKVRKLYAPSVSWAMPVELHADNSMAPQNAKYREPYSYRALKRRHIRLLYLIPGATKDPLQGVIIQVPYKSAGVFRALSYVWGTDHRPHELITPDGVVCITESLFKSLRRLRQKKTPMMIWVDAICINQQDNKEKAEQIRLLPKIFQSAEVTYAFIGDFHGSDEAVEMLMQVQAKQVFEPRWEQSVSRTSETESVHASHSEGTGGSEDEVAPNTKSHGNTQRSLGKSLVFDDWPTDLPRVPESWKNAYMPSLDDGIWAHVKTLFSAPWFRRMWIIQETVATPRLKVVCGKWTIDWDQLYQAMLIVDREIELADDDQSQLQSSWEPFMALATQREWEIRGYRWNLIMLLENFRYAESTLCRDRLFALLGLASDGNEAEFEPDYDSPLEVVVLRFARVLVRQGRGLQLLYRAGLGEQSHRFASWIPDWTVERPSSLYDSSDNGNTFAAAGHQKAIIKCFPDTDELSVQGYAVDVIQSISESSNVEPEWERYFNEVDAMVESAVLSPVRGSREDLKWKVPIACLLDPKMAISAGIDMKSSYVALRGNLHRNRKGKAKVVDKTRCTRQSTSQSPNTESAGYIAALQGTLDGWRFVVTERGYVGVVPNKAQVGDVVALFRGGRVPFILRKSIERPGAFRLVGECYVHGIMNGEGLTLPDVTEEEYRLY